MPIVVVTPDTVFPVSLNLALRHIRALESDADLVKLYLRAATRAVEDYTGRSLLTKTFVLNLQSWPCYDGYWQSTRQFMPLEYAPMWGDGKLRGLELRRSPLVAITGVKYWDFASSAQLVFDPANYYTDTAATPGRMVFNVNAPGFTFPTLMKRPDAILITFTAGYGLLESQMDPMLQMAVLMFAHQMFDNRVPVGDARNVELPMSLRYMLRAMKVDSLAPLTR